MVRHGKNIDTTCFYCGKKQTIYVKYAKKLSPEELDDYLIWHQPVCSECIIQRNLDDKQAKIKFIKERKQISKDKRIERKIMSCVRSRILTALTGPRKSKYALNLLGCTILEARKHLESQFKPRMTWKNHGEWHIDHIIPCASYNAHNILEQQLCFNYKNLQPLWAKDNIKKGDKYRRKSKKLYDIELLNSLEKKRDLPNN